MMCRQSLLSSIEENLPAIRTRLQGMTFLHDPFAPLHAMYLAENRKHSFQV